MKRVLVVALVGGMFAAGCEDSSSMPTTQPTVRQKLREAGENIRDAATIAATEAATAAREAGHEIKAGAAVAATQVERAAKETGETIKQGVHEGAQKVADWTATAPTTVPATQP